MRKYLFILTVMIMVGNCTWGQDWQCIQPNFIRHFNGLFVRGIKIDSVQNINSDIVFFPFLTPRGAYIPNLGMTQLDSNGGSWLGKKIILKQDGVMLFDTYWQDTVFIHTKANMGDSWIFYDDTSSRYYIALITAIDTTTIFNTIDSIKTITIKAYNNGNLNPSDLVHNQEIILSKNHGFYKTFSTYTFPFHAAQFNSYQPQQDYILDKRDVVNNMVQSYKLFYLSQPTFNELCDYSVGDMFEFEQYLSSGNGDNNWILYTVLTKTQIGLNNFSYTIKQLNWTRHQPDMNHQSGYWFTNDSTIVSSLPHACTIDTNIYQDSDLQVLPNDSSFCHISTKFIISDGIWSGLAFEPCYQIRKFKNGIGKIFESICTDPSGINITSWLIYTKKNNIPCGNYVSPLGINEIEESNQIEISPNPTKNLITIDGISEPTVVVYNLMGQKVLSPQMGNEISLASLTDGLYIVHVFNKDMELVSKQKLVKE